MPNFPVLIMTAITENKEDLKIVIVARECGIDSVSPMIVLRGKQSIVPVIHILSIARPLPIFLVLTYCLFLSVFSIIGVVT